MELPAGEAPLCCLFVDPLGDWVAEGVELLVLFATEISLNLMSSIVRLTSQMCRKKPHWEQRMWRRLAWVMCFQLEAAAAFLSDCHFQLELSHFLPPSQPAVPQANTWYTIQKCCITSGFTRLTSFTCFSLRSLNALCAALFCSFRLSKRCSSAPFPDFLLEGALGRAPRVRWNLKFWT